MIKTRETSQSVGFGREERVEKGERRKCQLLRAFEDASLANVLNSGSLKYHRGILEPHHKFNDLIIFCDIFERKLNLD